eukprot:CAMPEP_0184290914 /NCGR_PEP_ID=MMETSP1049-20130417/3055_1 /TAXON_ID=77928 /ORGANISM="Proteomonas sulcata, Strain CCMP704" /LENGTH=82 /DNA_ID=CAMNT_0026598201 /DNA_START=366 /DNA_END=610 /DNA_ORIENTATION=+
MKSELCVDLSSCSVDHAVDAAVELSTGLAVWPFFSLAEATGAPGVPTNSITSFSTSMTDGGCLEPPHPILGKGLRLFEANAP